MRKPRIATATAIFAALAAVPALAAPARVISRITFLTANPGGFGLRPLIGTLHDRSGTTVVASIQASVSGAGLLCTTCESPVEKLYAGKTGGRLYVALTRAPSCPTDPPDTFGITVVPVTRNAAGGTYVDLPPGAFSIQTVFRPGTLAKGLWGLCAWFRVDPALPISNPSYPLAPPAPVFAAMTTLSPAIDPTTGQPKRVRVP